MENIKILEPEIGDARGTIEVQYKAWLATYPNDKEGITIDDIEHRYKDAFSGERLKKREEIITNSELNEKYIIAKDGNKVVGICYGIIEETKNQLQAIYILPEYQGKGIGTKLWNEILSFFDKTKDIYVEVAAYNEKAIGFYKKLGFVDTGRRFSDERFRMKSGSILPEMEMVLRV
ncbi:MAG TPA: GNAT family N-acetyltransferase [Candidatus Paceibacterota bacterium]